MAYNVASLIGTAIALPLLGVVAVILRFYVRLRLRPTFIGIDDWLIVLAVVLVVGQGANQIVAAEIGMLGRDDEPIVEWRSAHEAKIDYGTLVIEKVTYSAMKLSVLFFYRRIFYHQRGFRIANDVLIVLITLWGIAFLFAEIFLCGTSSHHGHPCAPQEWTSLWFAITEVLGDIAILSLPYPCIRRLQMSKRDKIGLSVVFSLGTLSTIFGIIRLGFVSKTFAAYFHPSTSLTSPNRTPPSFWTTVEVSIGVFSACLPPLGPLIRRTPSPRKLYTSLRYSFLPSVTSITTRKSSRVTSSSSTEKVTTAEGDIETGNFQYAETQEDGRGRLGKIKSGAQEKRANKERTRSREVEQAFEVTNAKREDSFLQAAEQENSERHDTRPAIPPKSSRRSTIVAGGVNEDELGSASRERGSTTFPYDRWL